MLQNILDARRKERDNGICEKRDVTDLLLDVKNENGEEFSDEEIIDILIMFLNAGYESTSCATLWAIIYLHDHPDILKTAKVLNILIITLL